MPPRRRAVLPVLVASGLAFSLAVSAGAASGAPPRPNPLQGAARQQARQHVSPRLQAVQNSQAAADNEEGHSEEGDALEVADRAEQYTQERTAPGDSVSAAALVAARQAAARMPTAKASVREVTHQKYDAEPEGYTDPYWSNKGAGFGVVSGRTTALATDGNTYYAGAADGGVWKSTNAGRTWHSIWDHRASLSIGALLRATTTRCGSAPVRPTPTATPTAASACSAPRTAARPSSASAVPSCQTPRSTGSATTASVTSTPRPARASTATRRVQLGLLDAGAQAGPEPDRLALQHLDDHRRRRPPPHARPRRAGRAGLAQRVVVQRLLPLHHRRRQRLVPKITPDGDIDATDIGRTTLAYSSSGSRLYALVQSPAELLAGDDKPAGRLRSARTATRPVRGRMIAGLDKLDNSGSALRGPDGYHVGVQAWYNQALARRPGDPNHVYVGLEEVFETTQRRRRPGRPPAPTGTSAWPAATYSCPTTTHPDQHALAFGRRQVVIGNDGGIYSRPCGRAATATGDKNATLRTLQYYDAGAGQARRRRVLGRAPGQRHLGAAARQRRRWSSRPAVTAAMVLVDPKERATGRRRVRRPDDVPHQGRRPHRSRPSAPVCGYASPTAPAATRRRGSSHRSRPTSDDADHWVAGGKQGLGHHGGLRTPSASPPATGRAVHDFGLDAAAAQRRYGAAVSGATTYAAWVDGGGNPPSFRTGIDTNYGGTWHRIASPSAARTAIIAGLTVDPRTRRTCTPIYNGFRVAGSTAGARARVRVPRTAVSSWSNISGNLPDAPGDASRS